jgi:redox-sensitive bicupin YhaK (pirin superfamily)
MTAGTGIVHSEANPSPTDTVHLYQIWLLPEREGLEPSYEQRAISAAERRNRLGLVASPDGREGSLTIRQDALLYLGTLDAGREVSHSLPAGRHAWLQVLRGGVQLDGRPLTAGDGAAVSEEPTLSIGADGPSEVLLFDLA